MTITRSTLPDNSLLNQTNKKYDYVDSFQGVVVARENTLNSTAMGKAFFSSAPKWVASLMGCRNKIVAIFGLKTSNTTVNRQRALDTFKCEKGEQLGLFKIFDKTENEIILGSL
ncbi:MAG: DUF2867 domain-containing protein [Sphingobacteriales bacterium]|nr:DUF2867 domain-containing protein [Sphingobacteriales bacterium]